MFPASVHVASFASVFSRLWIVLSSLWLSSLLQVLIAKPSSSSVAGFTSVHSPQAWPVAATTVSFSLISVVPSASLNSFLQIPQVQYSMLPASVQVAAFSSVLLKSWPAATTVSDWLISCVPSLSLNSFPHVPQVQYAMFPSSVHVAAFASVSVRSWPVAAISTDSILLWSVLFLKRH